MSEEIFTLIPATAGPRLATRRGGAVYSIRPPGEMTFAAKSHFVAVMLSASPGMRSAFGGNKLHSFDAAPGMVVVSPAEVDSRTVWKAPRENMVISIEPHALQQLAAHELEGDLRELSPLPFGTVDPIGLRIAQAMQKELMGGGVPPNELYVDALITVFFVHLLRTYAGREERDVRGQLAPAKRRMLDEYIRTNLLQKLTISELAQVCGYSPSYFMQVFNKTYGQPPHRHIMNLRLSLAEELLRNSELPIAQIAYAAGFNSQSHLTTAMRKYRSTTPSLFRSGR